MKIDLWNALSSRLCLALSTATAGLLLVSCGVRSTQPATPDASTRSPSGALQETAIASTVEVEVELTVSAIRQAASDTPSPAPTDTPIPTHPASATPAAITISVSANTNCRSGPGAHYDYQGALLAGQSARVLAASTVEGYWYIENPDTPGSSCWLWDQYASLQGDPAGLPEYTPEPSPTPALDFILFVNSFRECGSTNYVHLTFQNSGGTAFVSGRISVADLDTGGNLYGPLVDRHPFAAFPGCPPDHGNYVGPGGAAYISIPLDSEANGHYARATIRACTKDYAGGDCITKTIDFQIP